MKKEVVEFAGIPVGIVVPDTDMLRFIAVKFHVIDLDNQRFKTVAAVKQAISAHLGMGKAMALAA
jgi:hypothetical protein